VTIFNWWSIKDRCLRVIIAFDDDFDVENAYIYQRSRKIAKIKYDDK
jgi:hypothetical protein